MAGGTEHYRLCASTSRERQGWIKGFEKLKLNSSSSSSSNKEEVVAWVRKAVMDSQVGGTRRVVWVV
jgi:hypothetical protein